MGRILVIVEVSQKQAYIFGGRKLLTNLRRSKEIEYVTGEKFFTDCWNTFDVKKNLVYTGGGHTVLQFENKTNADTFCRAVTYRMLKEFPEMEMFIHQQEYEEKLSHGDNLTQLSENMEKKRAMRTASFRQLSFGVERAAHKASNSFSYDTMNYIEWKKSGWKLTTDLGKLAGNNNENFIAVVHLDGNFMSCRVQNIYEAVNDKSWEECVEVLQKFSNDIDKHFKEAYDDMVTELIDALEKKEAQLIEQKKESPWEERILPIRKIIGAGDDVCFITAGQFGIECAVSFMKHLNEKINTADHKNYPACAGVVMIHTKYPFRVAYDISEELCSSAKKYGAKIKEDGSLSVIDWHIEFGQMKGSLSQIREDYWSEDNGRLELRPLVVLGEAPRVERSYAFFHDLTENLIQNEEKIARSKIKKLGTALHQGEQETKLAIRQTSMGNILQTSLKPRYGNWVKRRLSGENLECQAFFDDVHDNKPVRRCLYFDSIEIMDHIALWREENLK